LAILDCTCTIVFLTYIGSFRGNYTTALYIGEGISSLLPSFFALLQGVGDEEEHDCNNKTLIINTTTLRSTNLNVLKKQPRFSISVYFWLLLGTLIVSFVGFLLLEFLPSFQKEKMNKNEILDEDDYEIVKEDNNKTNKNHINNNNKLIDKILLLIAITVVAFVLYGFIPGLASYSALPYGNEIMHWCVTLGIIFFFILKWLKFTLSSGV
jgi:riboflavin transporter 2